jgi:hypothetical protein
MRSPILSLPSRNMKVNAIEVLNLRRWRGGSASMHIHVHGVAVPLNGAVLTPYIRPRRSYHEERYRYRRQRQGG